MDMPVGTEGTDIRDVITPHVSELRYHVLEPYRADCVAAMTDSSMPGDDSNHLV